MMIRMRTAWTRNLRGNRLDEVGTVEDSAVLFSKNDVNKAGAFYQMLGKVGEPMGMRFSGLATSELPQSHFCGLWSSANNACCSSHYQARDGVFRSWVFWTEDQRHQPG